MSRSLVFILAWVTLPGQDVIVLLKVSRQMWHQIVLHIIFIGQLRLRITHIKKSFWLRILGLLRFSHVYPWLRRLGYNVDSRLELFNLDEVTSEISCKFSLWRLFFQIWLILIFITSIDYVHTRSFHRFILILEHLTLLNLVSQPILFVLFRL